MKLNAKEFKQASDILLSAVNPGGEGKVFITSLESGGLELAALGSGYARVTVPCEPSEQASAAVQRLVLERDVLGLLAEYEDVSVKNFDLDPATGQVHIEKYEQTADDSLGGNMPLINYDGKFSRVDGGKFMDELSSVSLSLKSSVTCEFDNELSGAFAAASACKPLAAILSPSSLIWYGNGIGGYYPLDSEAASEHICEFGANAVIALARILKTSDRLKVSGSVVNGVAGTVSFELGLGTAIPSEVNRQMSASVKNRIETPGTLRGRYKISAKLLLAVSGGSAVTLHADGSVSNEYGICENVTAEAYGDTDLVTPRGILAGLSGVVTIEIYTKCVLYKCEKYTLASDNR